ncbi:mismatch-specific DNA-glycosylase [Yaniella flava]|uniref:Mismatch-specific DNA-glycosylase n=1 Tax=Yaniella flava TaxID=287930 RepID=A0ABN2UKZ3_9MICC
MSIHLPPDWQPWRRRSPLGEARPTKTDLAEAAATGLQLDDVLPYPTDEENAHFLRLLIVGTNPSPWAAAVQAPFARPGNRFWKSLYEAGITDGLVNDSNGLSRADEYMLATRGVGITNIVSRPSSRADELSRDELRAGRSHLITRVRMLRPHAAAFTGITAFRTAFEQPKAKLGVQDTHDIAGWPEDTQLWVVPDPSGLNAHESVSSLAEKWQAVWASSATDQQTRNDPRTTKE